MAKTNQECVEGPGGLPLVNIYGLNTNRNVDFTGSTTVALPSGTTINGSSVAALGVITSASANALAVGLAGATNPAFNVDSSTALQAAGLNVIGAIAAGTVAVGVISSGSNASLSIDAKGSGTIGIGATSTGAVTITPATTVTGALTLGAAFKSTTATLTGAGAVGLTTLVTKVVTTGANALTLADGTDGQIKIIVMITDGGDGTLTPTTKTGYSTIVFNDAGDGVGLVFTTTLGWIVFANFGATIS